MNNGTYHTTYDQTHYDSSPLMYPWGSPILSINSPQNALTVTNTSVPLNLTVIEPYTIAYRLDSKDEVAFVENTTLTDLAAGNHTLTIFTNDNYGNAMSQQITFTVDQAVGRGQDVTSPYFAIIFVVAAVVVVASLLLFRWRRRVSKQQALLN